MKFKAIFLDVDGVLVDSESVFNICWRKAAEKEGFSMSYEQALQLRSLDSQMAKEIFLSWYHDENAYSAIRASRKVIMAEETEKTPLKAKDGVLEFMHAVKDLPIKIAIVTSSPISRITEYLSNVGIDITLFDKVITTEQVKQGKPYPDVYRYACDSIGYDPKECIAVEDSPNGVKSAHGAGCFTVMVPDMTPCTEDLRPYVDLELITIKELLDFCIYE